jgi:putative intracellular protease/amidase
MQTSVSTTIVSFTLVMLAAFTGCTQPSNRASVTSAHSAAPHNAALQLAPPKDGRTRPLVVVLADNAGTETTDFVIPYAVLKESGVADVVTVSTGTGAVTLIPALRIRADMSMAQFDAATPGGADILIVPAMKQNDAPALLDWVRMQSKKGAMIVSICEGAWVIANAGLLEGKSATTHWFALQSIAKKFPGTTWVRNSRWVVDGNVMTTTGVAASIPASMAVVESIAGRSAAELAAQRLGVKTWTTDHDTAAFALTGRHVAVIAANLLAWWRHETVEIPVDDGFDEVSAALAADAWSRTYRSRALFTNAGGAVRSGRGLLFETEVVSRHGHYILQKPVNPTTIALDNALDSIASRYGEPTADLVALELEHQRRRIGRGE